MYNKSNKLENEILSLMMKYAALPTAAIKSYIEKMFPEYISGHKNSDNAFSNAINNLVRADRLSRDTFAGNEIVKTYKDLEVDRSLINAFWVLIDQIQPGEQNNHFQAVYPSSILFFRDGKQHEIISPAIGSEFEIGLIKNKNSAISDDENKILPIIIVANVEQLSSCIGYSDDMKAEYVQLLPDETSDNGVYRVNHLDTI